MKKSKNIVTEVIEEAFSDGASIFGGARGGGAGTFSYSQTAGARTWAPQSPIHRSSTAGEDHSYGVKDIGEEEEQFAHKAPKKRPFPLETVHDSLVDAFIQLKNVESQLKTCSKYNAALKGHKDKKAILDHVQRKVKGLQVMLKSVSADIDRISLS